MHIIICLFKHHEWDTNCDGYSGDEWTECRRCGIEKAGSHMEWDSKARAMRPKLK